MKKHLGLSCWHLICCQSFIYIYKYHGMNNNGTGTRKLRSNFTFTFHVIGTFLQWQSCVEYFLDKQQWSLCCIIVYGHLLLKLVITLLYHCIRSLIQLKPWYSYGECLNKSCRNLWDRWFLGMRAYCCFACWDMDM